ncbi:Mannosylfructose-phosphate synthase [Piscirickettsia salmonis]|uniref:glycosyltransferase family 4 protein n=1 Tax=Piscirickettsia salmonis TaxID=1238 RepID=UPI0018C3483B|nr:glycosyltransferase family 1 protein [Piscirickettsia salmonis]QGP48702.1 Mannosylfructose-phosphate synthase [Piscirickettsia salmonis]QGP52734.1 Mannosylfructose-phosphate synthase [Piscirickettsia salmonis]QGP57597.1 Mannosylfructose-phosphate synthase [Piscirickettsia salmonis]QGP62302.1 Mannosylfructose-phosphate synthase [Piscirickettsia salmonis]
MILFDSRWVGHHGIGRFAKEVFSRLDMGCDSRQLSGSPTSPFDPAYLSYVIAKRKPELFFSPGFNPPLMTKQPFIFTVHDLMHLKMKGEAGLLKKQYYEKIVKPAIHRAKRVLTVSDHAKADILEWAALYDESKVIVVGNGVDSSFSPEGECFQANTDYLLYIGNRKVHKNIDVLLEGFARSKVYPNTKLLLSGKKDTEITDKILRLNIAEHVDFLDFIEEEKLPSIYRGAKALIIPSLYEGFGLPALEAMACGTPVISSNSASLPEVVGDAGLLFDPSSSSELSQHIDNLMASEFLYNQCIQRGLERAKLFTWENVAFKVNYILQEILKSRCSE